MGSLIRTLKPFLCVCSSLVLVSLPSVRPKYTEGRLVSSYDAISVIAGGNPRILSGNVSGFYPVLVDDENVAG